MEYSHYALLLLIVTLGLLVAEIFIPSGGIITVMALLALAISVVCAWNAWWDSSSVLWWSYVLSVLILLPATVAGALYVLPRTSIGREILLEAPDLAEVTPYAQEEEQLSQLVGRVGKTLTLLNPGGLVLVDNERMHCECEGMMIDPGTDVMVVATSGNRLVVRLVTDQRQSAMEPGTDPDAAQNPPLDFDVPQS